MERKGVELPQKNTGKTPVSKTGGAESGAVGARNEFPGGEQPGAVQPGNAIVTDQRLGRLVAAYDALDDAGQAKLLDFALKLASGKP